MAESYDVRDGNADATALCTGSKHTLEHLFMTMIQAL